MKTSLHITKTIAALTVATAAMALPSAAAAAPLCYFNATAHKAVIKAPPSTPITIKRVRELFTVNGYLCGNATNRNTAMIVLVGDQTANRFTVDLRGGPLGPGFGDDGRHKEIEIRAILGETRDDTMTVIGSDGADTLSGGTSGISLNDDGDADIKMYGPGNWSRVTFDGKGGDDFLSAMGGKGSGYGTPDRAFDLRGGAQDDVLMPGMYRGESVTGDTGVDTVNYSQRFGGVAVRLDQQYNDGWPRENDNVDAENVIGTQQADYMEGNWQDNTLRGYLGNDVLHGGRGNDTFQAESSVDGSDEFHGGLGDDDKVNYTWREAGTWQVWLDNLGNDGAPGENDNAHTDIEAIVGVHLTNPAELPPSEIAPS